MLLSLLLLLSLPASVLTRFLARIRFLARSLLGRVALVRPPPLLDDPVGWPLLAAAGWGCRVLVLIVDGLPLLVEVVVAADTADVTPLLLGVDSGCCIVATVGRCRRASGCLTVEGAVGLVLNTVAVVNLGGETGAAVDAPAADDNDAADGSGGLGSPKIISKSNPWNCVAGSERICC